MDDAAVLIEQTSPNGNVHAAVEARSGVVYFYLYGRPESRFGTRACWVRNLSAAPITLDAQAMAAGNPPLLPAAMCAHPKGAPILETESLRIVWFEEGDAAALLEGDSLLAVIPGWSGSDGFHGYARDCTAESTLCWPLDEQTTATMLERLRRAEEFWRSWTQRPWPGIRQSLLDPLEAAWGPHTRYFAADGGRWPPKAIVQFQKSSQLILLTVGVSIQPQPCVEMYYDDAAPHRRIELGICVEPALLPDGGAQLAGYVSGQASLPWSDHSWLGHNHTVSFNALPKGPSGTEFSVALLQRNPPGALTIDLPTYRGDPVNVLWMIPITQRERELASAQGSDVLTRRLASAGFGWVHRDRLPVA